MKIALAGTGAMGVIHAKALAKIPDVEIVSIASRTAESGKKFAEEYKIPFTSTNLDECIDRRFERILRFVRVQAAAYHDYGDVTALPGDHSTGTLHHDTFPCALPGG